MECITRAGSIDEKWSESGGSSFRPNTILQKTTTYLSYAVTDYGYKHVEKEKDACDDKSDKVPISKGWRCISKSLIIPTVTEEEHRVS